MTIGYSIFPAPIWECDDFHGALLHDSMLSNEDKEYVGIGHVSFGLLTPRIAINRWREIQVSIVVRHSFGSDKRMIGIRLRGCQYPIERCRSVSYSGNPAFPLSYVIGEWATWYGDGGDGEMVNCNQQIVGWPTEIPFGVIELEGLASDPAGVVDVRTIISGKRR